ncbi:nuclear distribution protein nudF [Aspergillus egyptiacus]|nr:nuclear distribution protein nudF [Aspergillus egyptiacus]
MSQILTTRQAEELHKSMVAYLSSINASQSCATLREELQLGEGFDEATCKRYEGLLEKKWTGIARLQKKIMELEKTISSMQAELEASPSAVRSKNQDPANWLPSQSPTHTFESHRSGVTCVAFHPIYTSLASGSEDCTIKIWDWELGELERTIKGHTRGITGLDYGGPRGNTLLASCSSDINIKIWDPSKEYANVRTLAGHEHSVTAVKFLTPHDNLLVSSSRDGSIRIWDALVGVQVKVINTDTDAWLRDVSPSFDGKWFVSGGREQMLQVWEPSTSDQPKATLLGHENFIECCIFAPPASYGYLATLAGQKKPPPASSPCEFIASGARDKTIKLWEARGRLIKTLVGHDNWVRNLLFHPSGKYLISVADDKTIRCWDLSQEARLVKTIDNAHDHFISCIRWAPTPKSDNPDPSAETTDGAPKKEVAAKSSFRCVIATGSADSCVRVFS